MFTKVVFVCVLALLAFLLPSTCFAEEKPTFDEMSVSFNVPGLGGTEVEALITDNDVYLSVTGVFEYLKINNKPSPDGDVVAGFFLSEKRTYAIDKTNNRIMLENKIISLTKNDLITTSAGLYLKSGIFGKVFGLDCNFNFRSLSITLQTQLELPAIREKRQELMRQNIGKLKREIVADTSIRTKYQSFNLGAVDWSAASTQREQGITDARLNLRLGTVIAGGETNFSFNYDSHQDFELKQQNYLWRYANNDKKVLRQVLAGKIHAQSTASLYAPLIGFQLTNTPTTHKRAFGTYTLSDFTEPEWIVELYINNVLVDYAKADASGFFTFQVPMIYGNTALQLRFFGPWGEERVKEQNINVPYHFLSEKEMEYTFSAGMLENGKQSRFSRMDVKYGVTNRLTIGAGTEYLSTVSPSGIMPFVNASYRMAGNLFLSADYTYDVRAKAVINYRLPSDLLLEVNYVKYKQGQTAVNQNYLEERKAVISKPFRGRSLSAFSRLTVNQIVYPQTKQTLADLLVSSTIQGVNTNLTTYAHFMGPDYVNIYSNLSMTFRFPRKFTLRPQIQYGYNTQNINEVRIEAEKQLFRHGFLSLTYQNNTNYNTQSFGIGLRFDLSAGSASLLAQRTNNRTVFTQSVRGGAVYDNRTNYLNANNRPNVGKGGLTVLSFLDVNLNNRRDPDEPKIGGLEMKMNGGRIQNNIKDTTIQVFDLQPYSNYLLELNPNSFDNVAWQLEKTKFKVTIEPNQLKLIEVPVKISGEANGMVYGSEADSTGQARIIVNFYRNGSFLAARTVSESDGYFSFLGLAPGSYTASIDSAQMAKLNMTAYPASIPFDIAATIDGDIVDNLSFKLQSLQDKGVVPHAQLTSSPKETLNSAKTITPDNKGNEVKKSADRIKTKIVDSETGFSIQTNAFGDRKQALVIQSSLQAAYGHPVTIFFEGQSYYTVKITGFESRSDAESLLPDLAKTGFKNVYILPGRKPAPAASSREHIDKPKISASGNNPLINAADTRFLVVVGKATDQADIKAAQALIFKTLNQSSFPLKDGDFFRLQITGFTSQSAAEEAYQKLIIRGMKEGYIVPYKEKPVKVTSFP